MQSDCPGSAPASGGRRSPARIPTTFGRPRNDSPFYPVRGLRTPGRLRATARALRNLSALLCRRIAGSRFREKVPVRSSGLFTPDNPFDW